jgi:hypothetical protein
MNHFTTSTLIADIKRRGSFPDAGVTFDTTDYLALINEELKIGLVPVILSMHEEYFVAVQDVPLISNTSRYDIPYRAIGMKLRDLFYKDVNGNLREMTRINQDDLAYFQKTGNTSDFRTYYVENNTIVLCPDVPASPTGSLMFRYYLAPNEIVEETRVGKITSISLDALTNTTTYTLDMVPSGMTISSLIDIIQAKPGFKTHVFDIYPTSVDSAAKTITFSNSSLPSSGIAVGDHINFAGETIIPQVPSELHSILSQRVTARCLEALGDQAGLQSANIKLAEMEQKSSVLIDNRVEAAPLKITTFHSLLRSSKFSNFRRRRW